MPVGSCQFWAGSNGNAHKGALVLVLKPEESQQIWFQNQILHVELSNVGWVI